MTPTYLISHLLFLVGIAVAVTGILEAFRSRHEDFRRVLIIVWTIGFAGCIIGIAQILKVDLATLALRH